MPPPYWPANTRPLPLFTVIPEIVTIAPLATKKTLYWSNVSRLTVSTFAPSPVIVMSVERSGSAPVRLIVWVHLWAQTQSGQT